MIGLPISKSSINESSNSELLMCGMMINSSSSSESPISESRNKPSIREP